MQRVRKAEVQIDTWQKPEGLAYCLDCWKEWMRSDDRDLSVSLMKLHSAPENQEAAGYESNPYDDQRKADMKIGEATGAAIESLKPVSRWAIYKKCGITTQWRFPLIDQMQAMIDACGELEIKLQKNIATANFFD